MEIRYNERHSWQDKQRTTLAPWHRFIQAQHQDLRMAYPATRWDR